MILSKVVAMDRQNVINQHVYRRSLVLFNPPEMSLCIEYGAIFILIRHLSVSVHLLIV